MNRVFKKITVFVLMAFLSILLCGCSEEQKLYNEAKKMMELSGKATEVEKFSTAASKLTNEERIRVSICTYPEWAGDVFAGLGEYKDSTELAKKAYYLAATYYFEIYTNYQQKKMSDPRRFFLDRSYTLFIKAGDYKDAPALTTECGFSKMEIAFDDAKTNGRYGDVAALFQSFDDKLKEKVAELIYLQLAPSLAGDNWGMDEETFAQAYLQDLFFLDIIKNYKPVPADIREKMYRAAVQKADSKAFWEKLVRKRNGMTARTAPSPDIKDVSVPLQEKIFTYLGDYKDSPLWIKRIRESGYIPIINGLALVEKAGTVGSAPQARTVAVAFSSDGKVEDAFAELRIESDIKNALCLKLKEATKGNIFFTQDATQACAVIHYAVSHEHFGTFQYSSGGVADYYHTKAVAEIRSVDGTLLLRHSAVAKVKNPQSSIGGDFKHINIPMRVPVFDPAETLKILEKHFAAMENK